MSGENRQNLYYLKNTAQEYPWGSTTMIPRLLGQPEDTLKRQAELWIGAHPKAPSVTEMNGKSVSIIELIDSDPEYILGKDRALRFGGRLPFLLKVLAAESPLSIQVHPDLAAAKEGYERENRAGLDIESPERNYRDANHKPETICALTPFSALNGFRSPSEMAALLGAATGNLLRKELRLLDTGELKAFYKAIMMMDDAGKKTLFDESMKRLESLKTADKAFDWCLKLGRHYPRDIGFLAPLMLNLVTLEPGQAMNLPAGRLHSYLHGLGIEIMANSDNVIRGGLTAKHMDIPELLRTVVFNSESSSIQNPATAPQGERIFSTMAAEFSLSEIRLEGDRRWSSADRRSAEILLCLEGSSLIGFNGAGSHPFRRGDCALIPSAAPAYIISGESRIFRASVPPG
jgi:mannose-6-phosphate isomerase